MYQRKMHETLGTENTLYLIPQSNKKEEFIMLIHKQLVDVKTYHWFHVFKADRFSKHHFVKRANEKSCYKIKRVQIYKHIMYYSGFINKYKVSRIKLHISKRGYNKICQKVMKSGNFLRKWWDFFIEQIYSQNLSTMITYNLYPIL